MTPVDVLTLIMVLILPSVACRMGYRRGQKDANRRWKKAEAVRIRYCRCGVQNPEK